MLVEMIENYNVWLMCDRIERILPKALSAQGNLTNVTLQRDLTGYAITRNTAMAEEESRGRFENTYELLDRRALKFSHVNKIHIFQCMGKIFCVEFQRYPLKFHTKYLNHTLKYMVFIQHWNFESSQNEELISVLKRPLELTNKDISNLPSLASYGVSIERMLKKFDRVITTATHCVSILIASPYYGHFHLYAFTVIINRTNPLWCMLLKPNLSH